VLRKKRFIEGGVLPLLFLFGVIYDGIRKRDRNDTVGSLHNGASKRSRNQIQSDAPNPRVERIRDEGVRLTSRGQEAA